MENKTCLSEVCKDKMSLKSELVSFLLQFMQRGLDAEAKKQLEEDEKRIISDEHWYLDLPELTAKEYESEHEERPCLRSSDADCGV